MHKLIIKYFLPLFIFSPIFAQGNSNPFDNNTSTRAFNPASDNILKMTLSNSDHLLNTTVETNNQLLNTAPYLKFNENMINNKYNLKEDNLTENANEKNKIIVNPINAKTFKNKTNKPKFNVISSFRENIHFGGFYEKYAIINFTPATSIKPFDFININANQIYSCFITIEGIKEHFRTLFIQGAAVLAVDNLVKLFFGTEKMIPSLVGYAAKNIIISFLKSKLQKISSNQVYSYSSYNYSVNIRF